MACIAYQYNNHEQENCVLIHEAAENGNPCVSDEENQVYKIGWFKNNVETGYLRKCLNHWVFTKENEIFISVITPEVWSPPVDWTATDLPAVYRSFDNDKYVQLENGAQVAVGKVGYSKNDKCIL